MEPEQYIDKLLALQKALIEKRLSECESPMEALMILGISYVYVGLHWATDSERNIDHGFDESWTHRLCLLSENNSGGIAVFSQLPILNYRADIALVNFRAGVTPLKTAIEVDGHDYHERTKEQAQRDKSRDRDLCLDGWTTLRFTGAEVFASAYSCACNVHNVMRKRLEEWPHGKVT